MTFRNVPHTERLEELIRDKVARLEEIYSNLIGCHVAVEQPHESQRQGNPYRVRIDMTIPPGKELVVDRDSSKSDMHDDLQIVIRDAFDAARRRLKKFVEQQRDHRPEEPILTGEVEKLISGKGYGFIRATDGREVFFHADDLLYADYDDVEVGMSVRLRVKDGKDGPRARKVELLDEEVGGSSDPYTPTEREIAEGPTT